MEQWKYQAAQRAIRTLQGYAKQFKIRKMIHKIRCRKLRPIEINLKSLTNLKIPNHIDSVPLSVCMRVIDIPGSNSNGTPTSISATSTSKEYWIFESTGAIPVESKKIHDTDRKTFYIDKDELIIIPGITGHQMIVFDIIQRTQVNGKEIFIGQCCLRFDKVWERGGRFELPMRYMEYPPAPKFNVFGKKIALDYMPFLEQMAHLQIEADQKAQELINSDKDLSKDHRSASDKITGFLNFTIDVKRFSHAKCGFVVGSAPDDVCKYLKYHANALSIQFPTKRENAINSSAQRMSGTFSLKKVWVAVMDEWMYIYQTFGGILRYKINLRYCNIETIQVNDNPGVLLKVNELDKYGYGKLSPMQFTGALRRECLDWIETIFTAKRSVEGVRDLMIVYEDISKAKEKEKHKIELEARKQRERRANRSRSSTQV